jgi:hypothetical protein
MLFALFTVQLLIPDPNFRYYFSFLYIILAVGLVACKPDCREAVADLFRKKQQI